MTTSQIENRDQASLKPTERVIIKPCSRKDRRDQRIEGNLIRLPSKQSWPPAVLYAANLYNFFGGYTLLVIAMNGYVGDVTTAKLEEEDQNWIHLTGPAADTQKNI